MGSNLGVLEYRSLTFERLREEGNGGYAYIQSTVQQNFPSERYPFTRISEYKHVYNSLHAGGTIYLKETSGDEGEPYYPVPNARNQELYAKYKELARATEEL